MIEDSRIRKILYGGDYNPEQWEEEIWAEDMRILPLGHIDILTINVFSWHFSSPPRTNITLKSLTKLSKWQQTTVLRSALPRALPHTLHGWRSDIPTFCE